MDTKSKAGRPLEMDALTPLGAEIVRQSVMIGESLSSIENRLGWATGRIYRVIRSGAVRASDVSDLASALRMDVRTLLDLDARKGGEK